MILKETIEKSEERHNPWLLYEYTSQRMQSELNKTIGLDDLTVHENECPDDCLQTYIQRSLLSWNNTSFSNMVPLH